MTKQEQRDAALGAYRAIKEPAYEVYKASRESAYKVYKASQESAWEAYQDIERQAYKVYKVIEEPAYEVYRAELERIDNEPEETVVENWEAELEDLAAINYNLYLAGTVKRADTLVDWTHEQALSEIKAFIHTLLAAKDRETAEAYKKGFIDGGLSK